MDLLAVVSITAILTGILYFAVYVLVAILVLWLLERLFAAFKVNLDPNIWWVIRIILIIIGVLYLLYAFGIN